MIDTDPEKFFNLSGLDFDSDDDASGHKPCKDCGEPVFWVVTNKGWRLFESVEDDIDRPHVCKARLDALDREIKKTGVTLNLTIPEFKKK